MTEYLRATKHPWPTLLLLLPLLAAYEGGIIWLGGANPDALRNGADAWLRWGLEAYGLNQMIVAPGLVVALFVIWAYVKKHDRPRGSFTVCSGMALECFLFALVLWGLSHGFGPLLDSMGVPMNTNAVIPATTSRVITFVGAGIYEEILFRLVLFSGLALLLRLALVPKLLAGLLAAAISALVFSAAHHVGPYGEKMNTYVFLFRTMAGIYFASLYQFRGFGVAAGAHACYDVLVGLT
ncbi:MAG: type II CAAX prenyl endopeptidase Rce1 family protein [Gemmataceae bacterium]